MKTLGFFGIIIHILFSINGLLLTGAAFCGFIGEPIMILSAVLSIILWGGFSGYSVYTITLAVKLLSNNSNVLSTFLKRNRQLIHINFILSIVSAWVLGFGFFAADGPAWLAVLFHWSGLSFSVLGFMLWFWMPNIISSCVGSQGIFSTKYGWRSPLLTGCITYSAWGLVWLSLWLVFKSHTDFSTYPSKNTTPYKLPYAKGTSAWVVQGNDGRFSHKNDYAWDFRLSGGEDVVAIADGYVRKVVHNNDGYLRNHKNNYIIVEHVKEKTFSEYHHIRKGTAVVKASSENKKENEVKQGQKLAEVGNVGRSMTSHIHLVVEKNNKSIAICFKDCDENDGIPRVFKSYESNNK